MRALCLVLLGALVLFSGCKENLEGCTDPTALNYNPDATENDGSCKYPVEGCTDAAAQNFNPDATEDDGSCVFTGCTDPTADNYNPQANEDDGSCIFLGCTDPTADNYNPNANTDDGSCIDARTKFVGQYDVQTDCQWPFDLATSTAFSFTAQQGGDTIWLSPFSASGESAFGLVSGIDIEIPQQTYGALVVRTFSGTGSIDTTNGTVGIAFDYSVPFLGSGSCTATYTQQ